MHRLQAAFGRAAGARAAGAIDGERLWRSLMDLAAIGATPLGGVRRIALTDLDRQGRDQAVAWFRAAELEVKVRRLDASMHVAAAAKIAASILPIQARQRAAGVGSYVWSTSLDDRVRDEVDRAVALLLEANLIKKLKPRFNVILRDDKSFPYILIAKDHGVAQLAKHRGARNRKGSYFGPFASAGAVNRAISGL